VRRTANDGVTMFNANQRFRSRRRIVFTCRAANDLGAFLRGRVEIVIISKSNRTYDADFFWRMLVMIAMVFAGMRCTYGLREYERKNGGDLRQSSRQTICRSRRHMSPYWSSAPVGQNGRWGYSAGKIKQTLSCYTITKRFCSSPFSNGLARRRKFGRTICRRRRPILPR